MTRIFQATEHDLPVVRSLFLEYMQWALLLAEATWGHPVGVTPAEVVEHDIAGIQRFMPPDGRLLLASDDTGVVGCACAWMLRPRLAEIKRVYVRPSQRNLGTGRALIQSVIADLRENEFTTVRLETTSFMSAAVNLYRSLGFHDTAPYAEGETPADQRHHTIYLELSL